MRTHSATPGSDSNMPASAARRSSPTTPTIVRSWPLERCGVKPSSRDPRDDAVDLRVGGVGLHHDDHRASAETAARSDIPCVSQTRKRLAPTAIEELRAAWSAENPTQPWQERQRERHDQLDRSVRREGDQAKDPEREVGHQRQQQVHASQPVGDHRGQARKRDQARRRQEPGDGRGDPVPMRARAENLHAGRSL